MKRRSLIIITLAMVTFGCAHTHKINLSSQPSTFNKINANLKSKKARITLANGQAFTGKGPQIAPDSTFWFDPGTNNKYTVSTLEVEKIVTKKRGRGALDGLKYGAIFGGAAGLIVGIIARFPVFDEDEGAGGYGVDWTIAGLVFVGAIEAGLLGLPIGAIIGSKDKYIIIAPDDSSSNNINK